MCRLVLVVTADEGLAQNARRLTLPNAWIVVVCAPDALEGILDSFQVRHIVLDARSAHGLEIQRLLASKARSVPVSRSTRSDGALALLSNICRDSVGHDSGPVAAVR